MSELKRVVIVDAYAPTRRLAPVFHEAGYEVVRVQSTPEPPLAYRTNFDLSPYVANIVHTGDLDATVRPSRRTTPRSIVAGGEIGVEFADALSQASRLARQRHRAQHGAPGQVRQIETIRAPASRATRQLRADRGRSSLAWHA